MLTVDEPHSRHISRDSHRQKDGEKRERGRGFYWKSIILHMLYLNKKDYTSFYLNLIFNTGKKHWTKIKEFAVPHIITSWSEEILVSIRIFEN